MSSTMVSGYAPNRLLSTIRICVSPEVNKINLHMIYLLEKITRRTAGLCYIYNQFIIIKIATVNYSSVLFYGDTLRNTKTKGTVLQSLSVTNKNQWYGVMGL